MRVGWVSELKKVDKKTKRDPVVVNARKGMKTDNLFETTGEIYSLI